MGIELAPVTKKLKLNTGMTGWELLIATADYGLSLEELGVVQHTYISEGTVKGKREGTYGVFVWSVLTPQANEESLEKTTLKKINRFSRLLREEIEGFGLPLEVHTSFVRPEREQALRNHLERNKIGYSY